MRFQRGKVDFLKILKISVGCCLAIAAAALLGLKSSTSAGIITLLSIQNTKRETLRVAAKRALAFIPAVAVASIVFPLVGYGVLGFGVFLFFFILCCYLFRIQEGVSMSTVLMTHVWSAGELGIPLLINEFTLLCIGLAVGILVNLFMPRRIAAIREDQRQIDNAMSELIRRMAVVLLERPAASPQIEPAGELKERFAMLETAMDSALARAYEMQDNTLKTDMRYYVDYVELRMAQCGILKRIAISLEAVALVPIQAQLVACFMEYMAESFHAYDNAQALSKSLASMRKTFKEFPLPQTRPEFETRAVLFEIVNNLEYLILAKEKFAQSLTPWQIAFFWKEDEPESQTLR